MGTFADPVRNEEWRVLVEMDAKGDVHFVFARDAVRLHPPEDTTSRLDKLAGETVSGRPRFVASSTTLISLSVGPYSS